MTIDRHQDHQRLRRGHHAADRVHRELLDNAIDWRLQGLQPGTLVRLDEILGETGDFRLDLA